MLVTHPGVSGGGGQHRDRLLPGQRSHVDARIDTRKVQYARRQVVALLPGSLVLDWAGPAETLRLANLAQRARPARCRSR